VKQTITNGFNAVNKRSHFAAGVLTPALIKLSQRGFSTPLETPFKASTLKSAWSAKDDHAANLKFGKQPDIC